MAKVDADAPPTDGFLRSTIIYGPSRAGKTVLNSTFPRPAIFASEREGGYKSIQTMDHSLRYEPGVKPLIYTITTNRDFLGYFKEVELLIKKGLVRTVVVELSFYSDDIVRSLTTADDKNGWAKYKVLEEHVQWIDAACKRLNVRVAYNSLAVDPGDAATKAPGGLLLAGKALARKLPAATDLTGFLRTEPAGGAVDRVLELSPYGAYPAGHRYGAHFPLRIRNPTYRKLEDLIAGRAAVDMGDNVVYGDAAVAARAARAAAAAQTPPSSNGVSGDLPPLPSDSALPSLE